MKKIVMLLFILGNILSFSQLKDPFKNEKFDYVFKNAPEIFRGDYRCKFIIKQILLRSFHIDNKNEEMVNSFDESLKTYGRIIQLEGEFQDEKNPIIVTEKYYAKNCNIPEKKWLDYLDSPAFNEYFKKIGKYKKN